MEALEPKRTTLGPGTGASAGEEGSECHAASPRGGKSGPSLETLPSVGHDGGGGSNGSESVACVCEDQRGSTTFKYPYHHARDCKRLPWLLDTAYVASWMQCVSQVVELAATEPTSGNGSERAGIRVNDVANDASVVPTETAESYSDQTRDHSEREAATRT